MTTIYRMAFDFKTPEAMFNFIDTFNDMNRPPENGRDLGIVKEDSLHSEGKKIESFLVRYPDPGNGRVVELDILDGSIRQIDQVA